MTNSNIGGHTGKFPYVRVSIHATDQDQDLRKEQGLPLPAEHITPT